MPKYFIRVETGGPRRDKWHGPYDVMPKNKLKSLLAEDPHQAYDYTVYYCQVDVGLSFSATNGPAETVYYHGLPYFIRPFLPLKIRPMIA